MRGWMRRPKAGGIALLLTLLMATLPAHAETYRMDLIVFLDRSGNSEAPQAAAAADLAGAISLDNAAALQAAGITVLPDTQFGLQNEWQKLRNSRQFQPLVRIAWTQPDPAERGPGLRIRWGDVLHTAAGDLSPVDGRVKLLLVNRYLTLDADLVYAAATGSGWRLDERRKMRRDELHHLDSARLGILAKVSKIGSP